MTEADHRPDLQVTDRQCGACGLCCKLFAIDALGKPEGRWCPHFVKGGGGCGIYQTRPAPCRSFECAYLVYGFLDDRWRPDRARFFIWLDEPNHRMVVEVDPGYPDAWKKEPYYSFLKRWCRRAGPRPMEFCVKVGDQMTMLFPEADISLGTLRLGPIASGYRMVAGRYQPFAQWR